MHQRESVQCIFTDRAIRILKIQASLTAHWHDKGADWRGLAHTQAHDKKQDHSEGSRENAPSRQCVGCVVLQPMARQLHPLLAQQLESAGVDLPSLGHHGSSLLSLLHEISRTYERANVPCPPSAPLPRSRPSSLGAATAVHACNTATSSPGPSVSSGDPVIAHAEVLENLGGNPEARPACLSPGRRG